MLSGSDAVRESCGIFAWMGQDITPLRFRVPFYDTKEPVDSAIMDATRMYANRAYIFGYRHLSARIVRRAMKLVPFGNPQKLKKQWAMINGQLERKDRSGNITRQRNVEYIRYTEPQLLFEPYRGPDAIYMGYISHRTTPMELGIINGQLRFYATVLVEKPDTKRLDDRAIAYAFDAWAFRKKHSSGVAWIDNDVDLFPSTARGKRLVKQIAYQCEFADKFWAWAPDAR